MEYAGWEIVKMISEHTIKSKEKIIAHFSNGVKTKLILDIGEANITRLTNETNSINYGLSWLFQPKATIYFTI